MEQTKYTVTVEYTVTIPGPRDEFAEDAARAIVRATLPMGTRVLGRSGSLTAEVVAS